MPNPPNLNYLDPFILARIHSLQVRAKTVVEGFLSGQHQSSSRGHSIEFSQHREYSLGDELKHLDWKVYGRTDRFYIRQYEQETNLRLYLVLDCSGSMRFQGSKSAFSKFNYAATVAASLSYLTLKQGDSVGFISGPANKIKVIPPRGSVGHLNILIKEMELLLPEGESVLTEYLNHIVHHAQKRSLIVILSDLLEDSSLLLKTLKLLQFKKHEVLVLHLLDSDEKNFPYKGNIQFQSLENNSSLTLNATVFAENYRQAVQNLIDEYRLSLTQVGIKYIHSLTDQPIDQLLRFVLK